MVAGHNFPTTSTEPRELVGMGVWEEIERLMGVCGVIVEGQEVEHVFIGVRPSAEEAGCIFCVRLPELS